MDVDDLLLVLNKTIPDTRYRSATHAVDFSTLRSRKGPDCGTTPDLSSFQT